MPQLEAGKKSLRQQIPLSARPPILVFGRMLRLTGEDPSVANDRPILSDDGIRLPGEAQARGSSTPSLRTSDHQYCQDFHINTYINTPLSHAISGHLCRLVSLRLSMVTFSYTCSYLALSPGLFLLCHFCISCLFAGFCYCILPKNQVDFVFALL